MNIDELGPVAAKSYSSPSWSDDVHRPHFRPDYSRHGDLWVYGALAHREGKAFIEIAGCPQHGVLAALPGRTGELRAGR